MLLADECTNWVERSQDWLPWSTGMSALKGWTPRTGGKIRTGWSVDAWEEATGSNAVTHSHYYTAVQPEPLNWEGVCVGGGGEGGRAATTREGVNAAELSELAAAGWAVDAEERCRRALEALAPHPPGTRSRRDLELAGLVHWRARIPPPSLPNGLSVVWPVARSRVTGPWVHDARWRRPLTRPRPDSDRPLSLLWACLLGQLESWNEWGVYYCRVKDGAKRCANHKRLTRIVYSRVKYLKILLVR
jgi:hypothetical protein